MCEGSRFFKSMKLSLLDFSHSYGYIVVSHCDFNLHLPNDYWCWASFHVLIAMCRSWAKLLNKSFVRVFYWIACLYCSVVGFLFVFQIWLLHGIHLVNISSQTVACLLIFKMVFLEEQKYLLLMKLNLSILKFYFLSYLRNLCLPKVTKIFPMFSSKLSIVLAVTFRNIMYYTPI